MKIKNILLRELEKTEKNIGLIKDEIEELPKGSLVKIKAKENVYVYLKYRENKNVKSIYIGRDNDIETLKMDSDIKKRKKLEKAPGSPKYIQTHIGIGYRMLRIDREEG